MKTILFVSLILFVLAAANPLNTKDDVHVQVYYPFGKYDKGNVAILINGIDSIVNRNDYSNNEYVIIESHEKSKVMNQFMFGFGTKNGLLTVNLEAKREYKSIKTLIRVMNPDGGVNITMPYKSLNNEQKPIKSERINTLPIEHIKTLKNWDKNLIIQMEFESILNTWP